MKNNLLSYKIKLQSNNLEKLFNFFIKHDIEIFDLKIDNESITFNSTKKSYVKMLNINSDMCYNVTILKRFGYERFKYIFSFRKGLVVGVICAIILTYFANLFTFNYKILGLETIEKNVIEQSLTSFGIKLNSINNFNNDMLEQHLKKEVEQISIVSVMKKGTTLIINVKEKLPEISTSFVPIVADAYMLIENITVYAGFTKFKAGDIVRRGEVIVEPYLIDASGVKTSCKPIASIQGIVWYANTITFKEREILQVRSGKKIVNSEYLYNNLSFWQSNKKNNFKKYEVEEKTVSPFKNIFVPLSIKKTVIYELVDVEIEKDFEMLKDQLIANAKTKAFEKMPKHLAVLEEGHSVNKIDNIYYINAFIKCKIHLGEKNFES